MSKQDDLIGKVIGKYEILEEAGRGGMATVFRGKDRYINRAVAVKILPPQLVHDPHFYERFRREITIVSELEHPHIIPIYDYGRTDNSIPYLIMRFMGGGTFKQHKKDQFLSKTLHCL